MKNHDAIQKFIGDIEEEVNWRVEALSLGRSDTYDQYTKACGVILGLRESLDVLKNAMKSDEEEDS